MNPKLTSAKITIRHLASTGTYAIFEGSSNRGSNFTTDKAAVEAARKRFPGRTIIVKDFFAK